MVKACVVGSLNMDLVVKGPRLPQIGEAVLRAAAIAKAAGALVCLDPAPAAPLPDALYASVDVIDPNEVEAQVLTGVEIRSIADAERAASALLERGPRLAVVKMGDRGA